MTKRATFVSRVRLHAALCSAAILVSACGGSADTMGGQQMLSGQTVANPGDVAAKAAPGTAPGVAVSANAIDTAQSEPAAIAAAAPAPEAMPAATYPAVAGNTGDTSHAQTAVPAANFDLSGYQSSDAAPAADASQMPH